MGDEVGEYSVEPVQPVVEKSSKKKWIWISVVGVVVVLLVVGGYFLYRDMSKSKDIELSKEAHIMNTKCMVECPMDATLVDYENGMGWMDPEEVMEKYGGVEFIYQTDFACMGLCLAHVQEKIGISQEDSYRGINIYDKALLVWIDCREEFTKEGRIQCYEESLDNYSEEEISAVETIQLDYVPREFNASNLVCSEEGITFDYFFGEALKKIGIYLFSEGSSKYLEFPRSNLEERGSINIPKEQYYNSSGGEYNSFETIGSMTVQFSFIEEEFPGELFTEIIKLECLSQ
jgi:hypothetical protein